jgi:hypothetical protein
MYCKASQSYSSFPTSRSSSQALKSHIYSIYTGIIHPVII